MSSAVVTMDNGTILKHSLSKVRIMTVGIVGYGAYIPKSRIKTSEIARVWGEEASRIEKGLGVLEKAVAKVDEDSSTISVEAAKNALLRAGITANEVGAIYIGSESHPYAVKPTSTIVGEAIGAVPVLKAADLEFACKAGTAAIQMVMGLTKSEMIDYGMAIGADTAQGRPGDALEYSAASGGAAYIIGNKNVIAEIESTVSYATDTPDFWRRGKADYPSHGGRFTGLPAYFKHVISATNLLLEKTGYKLTDFNHVIFHQPNAKFPLQAAKKLGIPRDKLNLGLLVPVVGNTYSGNICDVGSPTGVCSFPC